MLWGKSDEIIGLQAEMLKSHCSQKGVVLFRCVGGAAPACDRLGRFAPSSGTAVGSQLGDLLIGRCVSRGIRMEMDERRSSRCHIGDGSRGPNPQCDIRGWIQGPESPVSRQGGSRSPGLPNSHCHTRGVDPRADSLENLAGLGDLNAKIFFRGKG